MCFSIIFAFYNSAFFYNQLFSRLRPQRSMHVCVQVCIFIYIYICIYVCTCTYVNVGKWMNMYVYDTVYVCIYLCTRAIEYAHVCTCKKGAYASHMYIHTSRTSNYGETVIEKNRILGEMSHISEHRRRSFSTVFLSLSLFSFL